MKKLGLALMVIALAGCGTQPGDTASVPTGRFDAQYQGAFHCGGGDREDWRAIYIITDKKTGAEYLAVQGCGTSQLVTEHRGKTPVRVER